MDEEVEDGRSTRNMDHGKLNKRKMPLLDTLEHRAKRKERQVRKAMKMWVKLT
jgi:hypothetical protein